MRKRDENEIRKSDENEMRKCCENNNIILRARTLDHDSSSSLMASSESLRSVQGPGFDGFLLWKSEIAS